MKRILFALTFASSSLTASAAPQSTLTDPTMNPDSPSDPARTGYAPVNGMQMYYEIHGTARADIPPLVLLHGGGDTIETSFGPILPLLARTRQVIAFEQRGFGHTADTGDKPFGFEDSADDTAALLNYLKIPRADLFGFSNGGSIALQVAIRHPELVRRIVACTAIMKRSWVDGQFWEFMKGAQPDAMPAQLRQAYLKVAPHPENLESFFYKCRNRMRDFQDVPEDSIRKIQAPTLVLSSDRDVMLPEGSIALYRLLPHAHLAILPGVDHMGICSQTDVLIPMLTRFLSVESSEGKL